tara:strand:- start:4680 stop:5189 length:510 start_codon:yes stop_codon:yes gene_type:complete
MSKLELRPRFRLVTPLSRVQLLDKLHAHLKHNNRGFTGTIRDYHVVIKVPKDQVHYWSPQLDLSLSEHEKGGTLIRCLLGPKPTVWTKFMFFYAAFGLVAVFGLMIGMSQITLENTPWGMWAFGSSSLALIAIYFIAQAGKKMGHDQMHLLYDFLLDELNHCVEPVPDF